MTGKPGTGMESGTLAGTLGASQTPGGHDTPRALFSLRERGHFLKTKRHIVYCKILGGTCPSAPGSYVYEFSSIQTLYEQFLISWSRPEINFVSLGIILRSGLEMIMVGEMLKQSKGVILDC